MVKRFTEEHSIIIPYHKNKNMLYMSIKTLEQTMPYEAEIIIIANNANKNELDINLDKKRYKIYKYNENLFYPKAINIGVQHSSAKYITICDPDIFYWENWHKALYQGFISREKIGAVSSKLLNPQNNRILDFGIAFSNLNSGHTTMALKYNHPLAMYDRKVQCACSAIMMTTREIFDSVNGIDENMPYAYCDLDFGIKLKENGLETWVISDSIAYHKGGTSEDNSKSNFAYLNADSKGAFYAKNYNKINSDLEDWFTKTFSFFLKENKIDKKFILIDLSSMYNKEWYYEIIKKYLDIDFYDKYAIPAKKRNQPYIELYDCITPNLVDIKTPIVYFVDLFTSLKENEIWYKLRDISRDIVIDKNGNIFKLSDISTNLC